MWIPNLFNSLTSSSTGLRRSRQHPPASRLCFEPLEDRRLLAFSPAVSYPTGALPGDAVAADFNGDGRLDLAAANSGDGTVGVLLGNGDGSFQAVRVSPGGDSLLVAEDFNGDGLADLLTGGSAPSTVLLAAGDGTFGPPVSVGGGGRAMAVGDLNGDGKADLVFTGFQYINAGEEADGIGYVQVLLGNGDGSFADPWTDWNVGTDPASVALTDLNGDGHLDVVTGETYYSAQAVYVLLGNGDGTLGPLTVYETGSTAFAIATADFNGDGKPDVVANDGGTLSILSGNGDGTLQAARTFLSGGNGLAIADYNGDGHADLATTYAGGSDGNRVSVVPGNGDGTFAPPLHFPFDDSPSCRPAVADFNGDGYPDLAVTTSDMVTVSVSVLLNDANWPALGAPSIHIADVAVTEGNTGTRAASFTVTLSAAYSQPVTVSYSTGNGTAAAGSDYQVVSGTLTILAGQTVGMISVPVNGDRIAEANETFFMNLGNATNATIADSQTVGTIVDDEPRISIGDFSKAEGKKGQTTLFTFSVTLSAAYDQPVTMSYRTVNATATTSNSDYIAKTGTLTFAPGETTKTITITVKGDSKREAHESFFVDLYNNSLNSLFTKSRGLGTILNDD